MKRLYLQFLFLGWIGAAVAQSVSPYSPPIRNGKPPKSEIEWSYPIVNFAPAEEGNKKAVREYTSDGKYSRCLYYNPNPPLVQEYTYEYDAAQQQRKCYWKKNEGQQVLEYMEQLGANGLVSKRFRFKADGKLMDSLVYQYDAKQRLSAEKSYNGNGQILYQTAFEYDEERSVCIEHFEDFANNQQYEIGVQMDAKGLVTNRKRYDVSGNLLDKTEFIRNEQGLLLEKRYYRNGKTLELREVYEYNEAKGLVVWMVYTQGGSQLVEYTVFEYKY